MFLGVQEVECGENKGRRPGREVLISGNVPWGRGLTRLVGSGKGCGLVGGGGATVTDEVKPTITSRAGWGCRPGWGAQGRVGVARRVVPLPSLAGGLSILILNPRRWPLAPRGRGATFFLLSSV